MKVKDAMTAEAVSVTPDATVCEIAEILLDSRISVVPVVDERGELVGIIDDADLIRQSELGMAGQQEQSWWLRPSPDNAAYERAYLRCHATRARDMMRRNVTTVMEDDPLSEVVARLAQHQVACAPVLRDGRLVGTISHADLIRTLVSGRRAISPDLPDDGTTRTMILEAFASQPRAGMSPATVSVTNGVATLWGTYRSEEDHQAVRVAVGNVPGVRSIRDYRVPLSTFVG